MRRVNGNHSDFMMVILLARSTETPQYIIRVELVKTTTFFIVILLFFVLYFEIQSTFRFFEFQTSLLNFKRH